MAMLPNPLPKLAGDPTGRSLGLGFDLPPGSLVDQTMDGPWHEPLLWYSGTPAGPGDWSALLPARRAAGLHPVLLGSQDPEISPGDWELGPDMTSYPGDHDAEDVLAGYWSDFADTAPDGTPSGEGGPDGSTPWPGLTPSPATADGSPEGPASAGASAPASADGADPDAHAAELADLLAEGDGPLTHTRLALVPARRSADIPAAIGWTGPVNYENDVARLCAVLRSWEDRFGIRVVALGFDTLVVSVATPPTTLAAAEQLAAEHYAFCPDNIDQGTNPSLRAYAKEQVLGRGAWAFWWD